MKMFGHDFQFLDDRHVQDLLSLEREGAIFCDRWFDDLGDFRPVRIALTDEDLAEYVRSMKAFDLFLGSGSKWAKDVKGIPANIADRADVYQSTNKDGTKRGPPWHCAAGFMGSHLESVVCYGQPSSKVIEKQGVAAFLNTISRAVDALTPSMRCFSSRERGLTNWPITCEDDVRDLLFAMLRAAIGDIRREEPIPSRGGTSKVVDLFSSIGKTLVEVKWIGKRGQWKRIQEQMHVDVQTYVRHPDCRNLVFVVIDAVRDIPDPHTFESELSGQQVIDDSPIDVVVYVREP
jgi:hypothetical protein